MRELADAHAHFFRAGYVDVLPESCRRAQPDEITLYAAMAKQYGITRVLAVGYEGDPFARGNNAYIAELARFRPWIRPLAWVEDPAALQIGALQERQAEGFIGLSIYLTNPHRTEAIQQVRPEVWEWLERHRWLISVNGRGEAWRSFDKALDQAPELRLLISHLGLPGPAEEMCDESTAKQRLSHILRLASYPGPRAKVSAFYALTKPSYAYPHRPAWPYLQVMLDVFGPQRLLWGSDFSPSLEHVSFPQTFTLLDEMPFLSEQVRKQICNLNLLELIESIRRKTHEYS
jgi:L-fuconolactonase